MDEIMSSTKCKICEHYLFGIGRCKFCNFQYDDSLPWTSDDWDIFDVDSEVEWSFLQIQYRLKSCGVDCLQVLDWWDNSVIVLIGVRAFPSKVASALGVNEECISSDADIGIMVINLYQEKAMRTLFKDTVNDRDVTVDELLGGEDEL